MLGKCFRVLHHHPEDDVDIHFLQAAPKHLDMVLRHRLPLTLEHIKFSSL